MKRDMENVKIFAKSIKPDETASIERNGDNIYLCARGKRLIIEECELYFMISLFMSGFYEDFYGVERESKIHMNIH